MRRGPPNNWWAVRCGRRIGLFGSWSEYQRSVYGYSGAESRGFFSRDEAEEYLEEESDGERHAALFADGAARSNPNGPSGAGGVLYDCDWRGTVQFSFTITSYSHYLGVGSNNCAEYEALIIGLQEALDCGVTHLRAHMDSQLVVRQMRGTYQVRSETLRPLYWQAQQLAGEFESFTLLHIGREFNRTADQLAKAAIDKCSDC